MPTSRWPGPTAAGMFVAGLCLVTFVAALTRTPLALTLTRARARARARAQTQTQTQTLTPTLGGTPSVPTTSNPNPRWHGAQYL